MAAKSLPLEGEAFTGWKPAIVKTAKVTAGFTGSGADVILTTQTTYPLVNVPAGLTVLDVRSMVDVAFTASVTLTLGDGDDADGYLASAKIAPQTAVTATGIYKRTTLPTAEAYAGGRKYLAADTIDLVVAGADVAAGKVTFFIDYIQDITQL